VKGRMKTEQDAMRLLSLVAGEVKALGIATETTTEQLLSLARRVSRIVESCALLVMAQKQMKTGEKSHGRTKEKPLTSESPRTKRKSRKGQKG
jgi:hypothetical protein